MILGRQIDNVRERVRREQQIAVTLEPAAVDFLRGECTRPEALAYGGRRTGNTVESRLINPLARYLFDQNWQSGDRVSVRGIVVDGGVPELDASHAR